MIANSHIIFDNVSKRFGETIALDDVNLTIEPAEFFTVFGAPSSGKTTLMRILLGLEQPDSGRVIIDGIDVTLHQPRRRNLSMVFQKLALFPHLTATQNIAFPLERAGLDAATIKSRIANVGDVLRIGHILHKKPGALSGGERQRVAIARSLVRDARAYLMDEPIAALDARLRDSTRVELKRLQTQLGHTFMYVTHDQEEAMSVADRMAILREGRILQTGAPDTIYSDPDTLYVARLVGSPQINVLNGHIAGGNLIGAHGEFGVMPKASAGLAEASFAFRAEDLKINVATPGKADGSFAAVVIDIERLGAFAIVTVKAGSENLKAIVRGTPMFDIGENVAALVSETAILVFDSNGMRVR